MTAPTGAHLVGSVPLTTTEEVFTRVAAALGRHVRRLPDGETGERTNWIRWQYGRLAACAHLEAAEPEPGALPTPRLRIADGVDPGELALGPLGYEEAALASYHVFTRLRADGVLPEGVRFQVSLPTPLAPVLAYIRSEHQHAFWPVYEAHLLAELRSICAQIPASDLAIQWDTAMEFAVLEGVMPAFFSSAQADIVDQLVRIGDAVPGDVELGYHLCYGDADHKHFVEPRDTTWLTVVANATLERLSRPVQWLHMPVPRPRDDPSFFAPLSDLAMSDGTELHLGLVHLTDGVAGARRRMRAAMAARETFGIATECGWGRRDPRTLPDLLRLHAALLEG